MVDLTNEKLATQEIFPGINGGRVIAVVIEKMDRDVILAEISDELSVDIDFTEAVDGFYLFDRDRIFLLG